MGDLRFEFAAIAVFAAAFVEISFGMPWASKGFSVAAVNSTPSRLNTLAPPVEPPPIVEARTEPVAPKPPPIPGPSAMPAQSAALPAPPAHAAARIDASDHLAQTALQAAQAYARAPCERMAKTMFIVAASTYLRVQDKSSQAPKDARVHDAIKAAFQTGHVSTDEFPPDLMISGRFAPATPSRVSCVNSAGLRP
ncbi:MAG: hypothetical protein ABWY66_06370 [Xanthobacteraceae bacterium]